jgi:hypothetical protein
MWRVGETIRVLRIPSWVCKLPPDSQLLFAECVGRVAPQLCFKRAPYKEKQPVPQVPEASRRTESCSFLLIASGRPG